MLLDLHCHGALGANFGTDEATSRRAAAYHRSQGAYVVASLVSAAPDRLEQQVRVLAPLVADGTILGIHLEGPCLAHDRRGAHDPGALIDPDPTLVERLAAAAAEAGAPGSIVHWTFARSCPALRLSRKPWYGTGFGRRSGIQQPAQRRCAPPSTSPSTRAAGRR